MAGLIYQRNKILGQIPINWENLWSYYIHNECRSQVTQIIKEERRFLSEGSDFGSMQHFIFETYNWIFKHAYLKMGESDPFPNNSNNCWGRVENKNSVPLTCAIFVCQYEDEWYDSSLWAMSEHLNVLYWLDQACSSSMGEMMGQSRIILYVLADFALRKQTDFGCIC